MNGGFSIETLKHAILFLLCLWLVDTDKSWPRHAQDAFDSVAIREHVNMKNTMHMNGKDHFRVELCSISTQNKPSRLQ